jgi:hypothetical protein
MVCVLSHSFYSFSCNWLQPRFCAQPSRVMAGGGGPVWALIGTDGSQGLGGADRAKCRHYRLVQHGNRGADPLIAHRTPTKLADTTELTPTTPLQPGHNRIAVRDRTKTSNVLVWITRLGTPDGQRLPQSHGRRSGVDGSGVLLPDATCALARRAAL